MRKVARNREFAVAEYRFGLSHVRMQCANRWWTAGEDIIRDDEVPLPEALWTDSGDDIGDDLYRLSIRISPVADETMHAWIPRKALFDIRIGRLLTQRKQVACKLRLACGIR